MTPGTVQTRMLVHIIRSGLRMICTRSLEATPDELAAAAMYTVHLYTSQAACIPVYMYTCILFVRGCERATARSGVLEMCENELRIVLIARISTEQCSLLCM